MKIQCDVCDKDEASVFCVADEAALCNACDHRVHHANKLAGKHPRFSLIQPSAKQVPLCDICQERKAFLFCQQDRAIMCRECDIPIHKANEHTQKHNRFLLTGVNLSANSSLYSSSSSLPAQAASSDNFLNNVCNAVPNLHSQNSTNKPVSDNHTISKIPNPRSIAKAATAIATTTTAAASAATNDKATAIHGQMMSEGAAEVPTSSISEYLIEMLPGWHVEDFLDPSSPSGFCKSTGDNDMIPLWDADLESKLSSFSAESTGVWVPQAAPPLYPTQIQSFSTANMVLGGQISFKESKDYISNIKSSRKWCADDNSFAVPQINPPSTAGSKRSRTLL